MNPEGLLLRGSSNGAHAMIIADYVAIGAELAALFLYWQALCAACGALRGRRETAKVQAQMLTATNDRRAYIRRRPVVWPSVTEPLLTARLLKYVSQVAYARLHAQMLGRR